MREKSPRGKVAAPSHWWRRQRRARRLRLGRCLAVAARVKEASPRCHALRSAEASGQPGPTRSATASSGRLSQLHLPGLQSDPTSWQVCHQRGWRQRMAIAAGLPKRVSGPRRPCLPTHGPAGALPESISTTDRPTSHGKTRAPRHQCQCCFNFITRTIPG